jgi:hypothetical protein
MMKLLGIATAAAALIAGGASAQPYGYTGGYLPAPAYAYAGSSYGGPGYGGYEQGYDEGNCDSFTLLGGHAGVTVLGINAGAGVHLGVGDDACHSHRRIGFVPPPEPQAYAPPPPPAYGPPQGYEPQPAYPPPQASPCCMAPPPPPPCGCATGYGQGYAQSYSQGFSQGYGW